MNPTERSRRKFAARGFYCGAVILVFPGNDARVLPSRVRTVFLIGDGIYYQIEKNEVMIYAVLDSRRDPDWIREQLG